MEAVVRRGGQERRRGRQSHEDLRLVSSVEEETIP